MTTEERARLTRAGLDTMDDMEPFLDVVRGMVAKLKNEGFTDEEARSIVASMFRQFKAQK